MCSDVTFKKCTECKLAKQISEFAKKGVRKDGVVTYDSCCKNCKRRKDSRRYKKLLEEKKKARKIIKSNVFKCKVSFADDGPELEKVVELCLASITKKKIIPH